MRIKVPDGCECNHPCIAPFQERRRAMSYKSIIVNLAIDMPPEPIVSVGAELAQRFGAHLIGLAAADVPPLVATGDGMVYEGEVMQMERTEIEKRLAELRAAFESLVPASITSEWGQNVCSPTR